MEISRPKVACLIIVATGLILVAASFSLSWYRDYPSGYEAATVAYLIATIGLALGWAFLVSLPTGLRLGSVGVGWASLLFLAIALAYFLWMIANYDVSQSDQRPVVAWGFYLALIGAGFVTAAAWLRTEENAHEPKREDESFPS